MNTFLTALLSGMLTFLTQVPYPLEAPSSGDWTCAAPEWLEEPVVKNNIFDGLLQVICEFKGQSGGGFPELEQYNIDTLVAQAQTIHQGPTPETYAGLSGTYFDATVVIESGDDTVTIRGDHHIATDEESVLVYDSNSTKVVGTGMASIIRNVFVGMEIVSLPEKPEWYRGCVQGRLNAEKPFFVPSSTFKTELKKALETKIEEYKERVVEEIAANI